MGRAVKGFVSLAASVLLATSAMAFNPNCGIQPIAPVGCTIGNCLCDEAGQHCQWQFVCGESGGSHGNFNYPTAPQTDFSKPLGSIGGSIGRWLGKANTPETGGPTGCPNKPGMPIRGCPKTDFPAGVVAADKAWLACLYSSMGAQMSQFADLNQAAEAAFAACGTEEGGLRAALMTESHLTQGEAETSMAYLKPLAKRSLLETAAKVQNTNPR